MDSSWEKIKLGFLPYTLHVNEFKIDQGSKCTNKNIQILKENTNKVNHLKLRTLAHQNTI